MGTDLDSGALLEPFERMLAQSPDWDEIEASGFLDALVPEAMGGAGLGLAEAGPLIRSLGKHAVALPVAETMVARGVLSSAGKTPPKGPSPLDSRPLAAIVAATEIAGAAERLLDMSLVHANERVQFGKPIGRNQVIQQMLAEMGEQVLMARMASQIGCAAGLNATPGRAALAKYVTSAAVPTLTSIAHAVHGAIGMTEEFPLHRTVALLHDRRQAHGSESYWANILGAERLRGADQSSLDFVRGL
jgi:acyl-CoA dehydrogenase